MTHFFSLELDSVSMEIQSKLSRSFQKVLKLKKSGIVEEDPKRAVMEALAAKLFAGVSSIKAAYAEMQMAQNPYNGDAIQASDEAVVQELKLISDLKRGFLRNDLSLSPQVTLILAEIQEQQSLIRTYEITMKKMDSDKALKDSHIALFRARLDKLSAANRTLEKKLSSLSPPLDNLSAAHFVHFLGYTHRSVRNFVKAMVREMESARWDLDEAARFIEPEARLWEASHRGLVFESFVARTMLEGFGDPEFSLLPTSGRREVMLDSFKKLRSVDTRGQNPGSAMGRFVRGKYLQVVHAKMECSFFGNLKHRKAVSGGGMGWPESGFFGAFAEMAKRVWLLHCLAYSIDCHRVEIFQAKRKSRFSEVYMDCATDCHSGLRVAFTVLPGFKIAGTMLQCLVYLSPPEDINAYARPKV